MRLLVVSDIHANHVALASIEESFDAAICLGDIVEYGVEPTACIQWVRQNCLHVVRGNHDHGAAQNVAVHAVNGFRYLTMTSRKLTMEILTNEERTYLGRLPTSQLLTLGNSRFLLVHASPRDPLEEYVPTEEEAWRERLKGYKVDFLCVGHTHEQFLLEVDGTKVVNPGSVGLQRDGDPRIHYAIIDNGKVELKKLNYDVERAVNAVNASGLDDISKRVLAEVYRQGRYIHPPELPLKAAAPDDRTRRRNFLSRS